MKKFEITQELASSIHHVALNEKGWWEKTIQRFILIYLTFKNEFLSKQDVIENLNKEYFNNDLNPKDIEKQINNLLKENKIVFLENNKIKISTDEYKKIEEEFNKFELIEQETKKIYKQIFETFYNKKVDNIDKDWEYFDSNILIPLINALGAKTYEFISGSQGFSRYDFSFLKNNTLDINMILNFLDSKNPKVKEYILRKLNAYFCYESSRLSKKVIERLAIISKQNLIFTIFVDTNFLFSALGLHNNPENEATNALIELTNRIVNKIQLRYYITELTVNEAKSVLENQKINAKNLRYIPNIYGNININGMLEQYFVTDRKITAREYFDKHLRNLKTYAEEKKIKIYNEKSIWEYSKKQYVIDDLNDELENQKNKKNKKTYEQLNHDIVLWNFVKDKRDSNVESPIEAKYWIVTNDNKFISFDKRKMKKISSSIPICINPTSLIQLLQFWIPRTEEFEEAMLKSLKLPFLFHEFDSEAERVTIEILNVLSAYEQQETTSLSTDTLKRIVLNETLRKQVSLSSSQTEKEQSVENALIKEMKLQEEKHIKETKEHNAKIKEYDETIREKEYTIEKKNKVIEEEKNKNIKLDKEKNILEQKASKNEKIIEELLKERYLQYKENYEKEVDKQTDFNFRKRDSKNNIKIFIIFILFILYFWVCYIQNWLSWIAGIPPILLMVISLLLKMINFEIIFRRKKFKIKIKEQIKKENPIKRQ